MIDKVCFQVIVGLLCVWTVLAGGMVQAETPDTQIDRVWTLNLEFRKQIHHLYENCYSELKHNDETFTSPVPDRRHKQWRNLLKGYLVNLHGPPMDFQPMSWASPVLIQETVNNWYAMGYVKGAEIYALSCFDWPYTQYAEAMLASRQVTDAMIPDKLCDLLCTLSEEALESARAARAATTPSEAKAELDRFVTDSQMYVLATRALRHKVSAATLKARMLHAGQADLSNVFEKHMQQSVKIYENLAQLTDRTYRNANDLMGRHWKREGLAEFRKDMATQTAWLAAFQKPPKTTTLEP